MVVGDVVLRIQAAGAADDIVNGGSGRIRKFRGTAQLPAEH